MADVSYDNHSDKDTAVARKRHYENDGESNDNDTSSKDSKRAAYAKEPLVKLLVPNDAAGALIGKGGANLGDLKSRYGASMRLSHNRELYPGTDERIVVLTGEVSQIIDLHNYIIDKVADARGANRTRDDHRGQQVKIILPNNTAGLIIGKGGETIKAMKEETKANILITGRDESPVHGERILIIKGNTEQRIEAARVVISKIASDPDNMANTSMKYSHRSRDDGNGQDSRDDRRMGRYQQDNRNNNSDILPNNQGGSLGMGGAANPNNLSNLAEVAQQLVGLAQGQGQGQTGSGSIEGIKTTVQIQMEIPELLVSPIMGIQGINLHEFMQFSGAKIEFARSNLSPSHKQLTILGDLNETQIAYHLVTQKITQVRNELLAAGLQRR